MLLKMKKDCLILDRGISEEFDRFLCFVTAKDGLVDNNGIKSIVAKRLTDEMLVKEAVKLGAELVGEHCVVGGGKNIYGNDAVLAYNGGDLIFADDEIGIYLLENDLVEGV